MGNMGASMLQQDKTVAINDQKSKFSSLSLKGIQHGIERNSVVVLQPPNFIQAQTNQNLSQVGIHAFIVLLHIDMTQNVTARTHAQKHAGS